MHIEWFIHSWATFVYIHIIMFIKIHISMCFCILLHTALLWLYLLIHVHAWHLNVGSPGPVTRRCEERAGRHKVYFIYIVHAHVCSYMCYVYIYIYTCTCKCVCWDMQGRVHVHVPVLLNTKCCYCMWVELIGHQYDCVARAQCAWNNIYTYKACTRMLHIHTCICVVVAS